jgi:hypothetical protein
LLGSSLRRVYADCYFLYMGNDGLVETFPATSLFSDTKDAHTSAHVSNKTEILGYSINYSKVRPCLEELQL